MKVGLNSFPSFTTLMILLLLGSPSVTVTLTGLWYRLTHNLHLDFSSLQPQWTVPEPSQRLGLGLITDVTCNKVWWCLLSEEAPLRYWHWVIRVAGSQLGVCVLVSLTLGRRGAVGDSWCVTIYNFLTIIFICCTGWYTSKIFRIIKKHYFQ